MEFIIQIRMSLSLQNFPMMGYCRFTVHLKQYEVTDLGIVIADRNFSKWPLIFLLFLFHIQI